jgi:hypothetical protein
MPRLFGVATFTEVLFLLHTHNFITRKVGFAIA